MKPKRRLKKIFVDFISLVEDGANKRVIIWKSILKPPGHTPFLRQIPISKIDEDQHMIFGIVYAVEDVDTEGDIASAEVIKDAAYRFMREKQQDRTGESGIDSRSIDKMHNANPDEGYVAETYIVLKGNSMFPDDENAWAVGIKVENEDTWAQVKKGEIKGLSMGGEALVEDLEKKEYTEMDIQKFTNDVLARLEKAYVEFKWSGSTEEAAGTEPTSIKGDLEALLKEVDKPEDALGIIKSMEAFTGTVMADAREILKAHLPEPEPDPKPGADSEAIIKAVTESITGAVKPLAEEVDKISKRLETVEKNPVGRQTERGDPADNGKSGVRTITPGAFSGVRKEA